MKVSFVRGAYLNNFEGQNYAFESTDPSFQFAAYSSFFPIDTCVLFPLTKLPSISDMQKIPLLNVPVRFIANRTLGDSQILFGLEDAIIASDIVHVADPHYYYSYQAARLREQKKINKLISTWWETIPFNNESTRAKRRIKKYAMEKIDMFLCYTNKAKACLLAEGIAEKRIIVIPLAVDINTFKPREKKDKTVFTILFVGRLVEEKGILDAYEIFKKIAPSMEHVMLKIVGDGPLKKTIQRMVSQDGLGEKVTIETKKYSQMPQTYQEADVLLVPSKQTKTWEEQYGMVFIEAMASGLPIVSYATGSIPEVVDKAGMLFDENKPNELTSSLIRLIRERDLGTKIGTMGRERAKKYFDAKKTSKKIFELYTSL